MRKLVPFWVLSLVLVSLATFAFAQTTFQEPRMLSGGDIGFRLEGTDELGKAVGTLMVRIDGRWVEIGPSRPVFPTD